jgi:hypothetical protein
MVLHSKIKLKKIRETKDVLVNSTVIQRKFVAVNIFCASKLQKGLIRKKLSRD